MRRCITTGSYSHICDVYDKVSVWDFDTHTSIDSWELIHKDVPCNATSFVNGGIMGNGSMEKWDQGMYTSDDYVRLKTKRAVLKSQRITNIRSLGGEVVWQEEEFDGEPTLFDVDGCAPVTDPFSGTALEFVSTLARSEIQSG